MKATPQQLLLAYSSVVGTVVGIVVLSGAVPSRRGDTFDEIKVHRIDVVEPDGTRRMVISNGEKLPGVIVKGVEHPRVDRPQAGMIFYNDEGSENGGLIFGGHRNKQGEVAESGGSLSFDNYGPVNQVIQLVGVDDKDNRFAGLAVSDRRRRVWVGRTDDGTASLSLMDTSGKKRITLQVTADGTPSLAFFDNRGNIVQQWVPKPSP